MTKRKSGEEVFNDLTADEVKSSMGTGGTGIDVSLARFIARLEQIINRVGGSTPISKVAESPISTQSLADIQNLSKSLGMLEISVKGLTSMLSKSSPAKEGGNTDKLTSSLTSLEINVKGLTAAIDRSARANENLVIKQVQKETQQKQDVVETLDKFVPQHFGERGKDANRRKELLADIGKIEDKQIVQQVKSRLLSTHPAVTSAFGEVLNNQDLLENLGEIRQYNRLPSDKLKGQLQEAAGDPIKLKEIFQELNSGSKSVGLFNRSLLAAAGAIGTTGTQLLTNSINYQTSLLNSPYTSLTNQMSREAQYRMQQKTTFTAGGGALAGAAIGSIIPGVGTLIGAGVGAAVGGGIGYAVGKYGASSAEVGSDQYKQNIRNVLGYNPSEQGMKALSNVVGTSDYQRLAEMSTSVRGVMGAAQVGGAFTEGAATNYMKLGQAYNMPNMTPEQAQQMMVSQTMLNRMSGLQAGTIGNIAQQTGLQGSTALQGAEQLAYAPAVVDGTGNLNTMAREFSNIAARTGGAGSMAAQAYVSYENKGMIGRLSRDAMSRALLGKSAKDVFEGIGKGTDTKESLLKNAVIPASLMKEIAPDVFKELAGATKTEDSPAKQSLTFLQKIEKNTATMAAASVKKTQVAEDRQTSISKSEQDDQRVTLSGMGHAIAEKWNGLSSWIAREI